MNRRPDVRTFVLMVHAAGIGGSLFLLLYALLQPPVLHHSSRYGTFNLWVVLAALLYSVAMAEVPSRIASAVLHFLAFAACVYAGEYAPGLAFILVWFGSEGSPWRVPRR